MRLVKRVGIDLHVVDGIFQGSRSHVLELFSRVINICPNIEFYLFLEKTEILRGISDNFSLPNVHLITMKYVNPIRRLCIQLPSFQKKYKLDLLHTQYVSPIPSYSKTIITLHDILFESHPQYFSALFVIRSRILMRISAKFSAHIFTVSSFSKDEITTRYDVSSEDITTIYNGVDLSRFYPKSNEDEFLSSRPIKSGEYILTVGRLEPRKNHALLLKAYAQLDTDIPLVIIGQRHYGFHSVDELVCKLNISERVIFLESVTDEQLAAYYRGATLFVYPTWAEGFGMPVIEAMASGVPVITSNTTSLSEVAGDAGVLISPNSVLELKEAMENILNNKVFSHLLAEKGLVQASKFDWDVAALKVKEVYEEILSD